MAVRIGIISDTHGILRPEVLEILGTCSVIFHAGDFDREEILDRLRPLGSVYAVRGNNDGSWARCLRTTLSFTLEGVRFHMVHDRRDASSDLGNADVVIFGHSHRYEETFRYGRLWLNPGSCGRSRFGLPLTMAVMTVENGSWEIEKRTIAC